MADIADGYAAYYSSKLWALLPAIYRTLDPPTTFDPGTTQVGPLQEIVNRIGATAAVLRRSIDRMWEDQSIESCDDWVIPYIAAQVATNLVSGSDARQQRIDVAKTMYYRRQKGTLPLLEELAHDITGWEVRVVEMFQSLGRSFHGLDPAPSPDLLGTPPATPPGGFADLHKTYTASRRNTAFDRFAHTFDARVGSGPGAWRDLRYAVGQTGWYNPGNLAIFIYRLDSVSVDGVTPVPFQGNPSQLTFDPTGRQVPLFSAPLDAYGASWVPRREEHLPGKIDRELLAVALDHLYGVEVSTTGGTARRALALYSPGSPALSVIPSSSVSADPRDEIDKYVIDPEAGTLQVPDESPPPVAVGYRYGFSSDIGAGGYDRRQAGEPAPSGCPTLVSGGGALPAATGGVVQIQDSRTYEVVPDFEVTSSLVLQALNFQRPVARPASRMNWTFTGAGASRGGASTLVLDGLLVSGCDVVLDGEFDTVRLSTVTLDPGEWRDGEGSYATAADGRLLEPTFLVISGVVRRLVIDRSILGPVVTDPSGMVETVVLQDSIIQAAHPGQHALAIRSGMTRATRCTVLGRSRVHALEASDSIFERPVTVADDQRGCARYTAFASGSRLPSQYACVPADDGDRLFASMVFGRPDYAALLPTIDPRIGAGASNGSEMGVFCRENHPIRERSLVIKYKEYMPIGLAPVLVYVT